MRLEIVNGIFVDELRKFVPTAEAIGVISKVVSEAFKDKTKALQDRYCNNSPSSKTG
jgi:hypothetical protein